MIDMTGMTSNTDVIDNIIMTSPTMTRNIATKESDDKSNPCGDCGDRLGSG